MKSPTLAEKLGMTTQDSPLLEKARRLGLGATELESLAILRGCDYYSDGRPPAPLGVHSDDFSDEELVVALLSPLLPPSVRGIRLAAALLGGPAIRPEMIAKLAVRENCAGAVRYIAESGHRVEPDNILWRLLADLLPATHDYPARLPHPSRFVEMTGIDRGRVGRFERWIRPHRGAA